MAAIERLSIARAQLLSSENSHRMKYSKRQYFAFQNKAPLFSSINFVNHDTITLSHPQQ
jgi:hypothetical protein